MTAHQRLGNSNKSNKCESVFLKVPNILLSAGQPEIEIWGLQYWNQPGPSQKFNLVVRIGYCELHNFKIQGEDLMNCKLIE